MLQWYLLKWQMELSPKTNDLEHIDARLLYDLPVLIMTTRQKGLFTNFENIAPSMDHKAFAMNI